MNKNGLVTLPRIASDKSFFKIVFPETESTSRFISFSKFPDVSEPRIVHAGAGGLGNHVHRILLYFPTNNWLANSLLSPECPAESHGWPPNRRRAVIAHGYSGGNPASELGSGDVQTTAWRFSEE